jgi:frataxin
MPDSDNPDKPAAETKVTRTAVQLSDGEYHIIADTYMEVLVSKLEDLQDEKEGIDVEYSVR